MIAHLTGRVSIIGATSVVLDVAGVGLLVLCTPATGQALRLGEHATLYTHLVVREDSLTLFGFASVGERETFEILQSVQGVGPKLALAMLSVHTPQALAIAVASADRAALERVPGVGAKVAARLLLELGGRLEATSPSGGVGDSRPAVLDALVGLGWNARASARALEDVAPDPIEQSEVPVTLRAALKVLGGARG